jgi:hypothetical protein
MRRADNLMHGLKSERFFKPEMVNYAVAVGDGKIKTFPLRWVKDNPPHLHGERLVTLDDTVEFFNVILDARRRRSRIWRHSCAPFPARWPVSAAQRQGDPSVLGNSPFALFGLVEGRGGLISRNGRERSFSGRGSTERPFVRRSRCCGET